MTDGTVGSVGLLLDVCGAFFLSQSFVLKKRAETVRETRSYWGVNPYSLRSSVYQGIEARIGFAFLSLGFFGQFLVYSGWLRSGRNQWPVPMLLAGLVSLAASFFVARVVCRAASRRAFSRELGPSIRHELAGEELAPEPALSDEERRFNLAVHYRAAWIFYRAKVKIPTTLCSGYSTR